MSDVAAYYVFVYALFPIQGRYVESTYLTALETTYTQIHDMLSHRS